MRDIINLNQGWQFIRKDVGLPEALPTDWTAVDLPHTWNAVDGQDESGNYYRGRCWYARKFTVPLWPLAGGRLYVEVLAAGQQATVYVNGKEVVCHEGGYSCFRADITGHCHEEGENLLVIACSNEKKDGVYPRSTDFTLYGGLYRGVNLIHVPDAHFELDYYGGPGLQITPKPDMSGGAIFELVSWIHQPDRDFTVSYSIRDMAGREVGSAVRPAEDAAAPVLVPDVTRWEVGNPYLYTVTASLMRHNEVYDEVSARVGVRAFYCDPLKGFVLNGTPVPLRGVSRHQDWLYKGNALTRQEHYEDAHIIKELGANTIRLAYYQHSQDFYDACDEMGFIVWAEIPFIGVMNPKSAACRNCISQMKELIIQNYNHPSICFWGISSEVIACGISEKLVENHMALHTLCKDLDPTRLTAMVHAPMTPVESLLHNITDVESYSCCFGRYGKEPEDNGSWLDDFHRIHPEICLGLSRCGWEGSAACHGQHTACQDYSEEYQALYHEHMAKMLDERPWIWFNHIWSMFDFGCAGRSERGIAGRNSKGLMTMDRKIKKDSYYIYQAYWSGTPMIHLCGRKHAQRAGRTTEIRVYSNQPAVELYLNGKLAGKLSAEKVFVFTVALRDGFNTVVAAAGTVKDSITLEKVEEELSIYVLPEAEADAQQTDSGR